MRVLNGAADVTVECPAVFTDPGATASDACAGDLTGSIAVSGAVGSGLGTFILVDAIMMYSAFERNVMHRQNLNLVAQALALVPDTTDDQPTDPATNW